MIEIDHSEDGVRVLVMRWKNKEVHNAILRALLAQVTALDSDVVAENNLTWSTSADLDRVGRLFDLYRGDGESDVDFLRRVNLEAAITRSDATLAELQDVIDLASDGDITPIAINDFGIANVLVQLGVLSATPDALVATVDAVRRAKAAGVSVMFLILYDDLTENFRFDHTTPLSPTCKLFDGIPTGTLGGVFASMLS